MEPLCCHWVDGLWATVLGLSNLAVPSQVGCPLRKGSKEQMARRQGGGGRKGLSSTGKGPATQFTKAPARGQLWILRASAGEAATTHRQVPTPTAACRQDSGSCPPSQTCGQETRDPTSPPAAHGDLRELGVGGQVRLEFKLDSLRLLIKRAEVYGLLQRCQKRWRQATYNEQQKTMPRKHKTTPCLYSTGW